MLWCLLYPVGSIASVSSHSILTLARGQTFLQLKYFGLGTQLRSVFTLKQMLKMCFAAKIQLISASKVVASSKTRFLQVNTPQNPVKNAQNTNTVNTQQKILLKKFLAAKVFFPWITRGKPSALLYFSKDSS